jgi:hypothetical protein
MVIIYDFKENNYQQILFYQLLYMATPFYNFMKQKLQNKKTNPRSRNRSTWNIHESMVQTPLKSSKRH